ncbi:MAG: 1-acyl-sn-glycerol-3-phosphate acyltransferase [Salinisphaera sp.]|nr:1-acyl-sn-glycerol-3-phosphate acyltransferase [Salinisphaera sp.]
MIRLLRFLFFAAFVRPVLALLLGMNVRDRHRLPDRGPAIVIANHNSHLDTMVMMSLLPLRLLPRVRPIAAADYFLSGRGLAWFSLNIIGIVPLKRQRSEPDEDLLAPCSEALEDDAILIFFPEGSRGEPERMAAFKSGIARLAERHPEVPVTPVFLHGLGKALPRGEALLVPLMLDVFVGEPIRWDGRPADYMQQVTDSIHSLAANAHLPAWD